MSTETVAVEIVEMELPAKRHVAGRPVGASKYKLAELEVGQAAVIKATDKLSRRRAYGACAGANKRYVGKKFTARVLEDGSLGIFRIE